MMTLSRMTISLFLFLLMASITIQAQENKPLTLSTEEINAGWLMLFDGETTMGWKVEGDTKVEKNLLILGGEKASKITTTSAFRNFLLKIEVEVAGEGKCEFHGWSQALIPPKSAATGNLKWEFISNATEKNWEWSVTVDPSVQNPVTESKPAVEGGEPISFTVPAGKQLRIRSIKLRPQGMRSLFNGKDLTGWNVYRPKQFHCEFSVTKEGFLHLQKGYGDLQTTEQFDDFVLQLRCQTLGKHLNSGVFFRCIADQYQNGYEAQIHNKYKGEDRTKPTDYGTGAIYRRTTARKIIANDLEWFTMSIIAQGDHFSTWVNGYQMVDWVDKRKPNPNPRNGLRLEKGHISLQGHDPSANFYFKQIEIAECKPIQNPTK